MRVYGKSTIENEDDEYFAYYYDINNNVLEEVNKDAKYAVAFKMKDGKLDIYEVISLEDNLSEWYTGRYLAHNALKYYVVENVILSRHKLWRKRNSFDL